MNDLMSGALFLALAVFVQFVSMNRQRKWFRRIYVAAGLCAGALGLYIGVDLLPVSGWSPVLLTLSLGFCLACCYLIHGSLRLAVLGESKP